MATNVAEQAQPPVYEAEKKDLYEVGEIPPLGHVPKNMYAWAIRQDRHGPPDEAMQVEVVPTWEIDSNEVLVLVMAAGVNYNGIWAALGQPITPFAVHKADLHVAGSDASGIVWAVGSKVKRWKVGDEVVIHCNQDDGDDEECNGGDPMFSPTQRIWGYETPDGSFAQFCRVQAQQLMPRPQHLTWEESACYTLTLATAYRMLFGHPPHDLKPADNVLVWGASGGLGSMAIQLIAAAGANAIGVISDDDKREFVTSLGARGVINRRDFDCWGQMPTVNTPEYAAWLKGARAFGKAIWDITGKGNDVDMVFEHPGEATFPVSCLVAKRGGMVVFCAGTSGYNLTFDARYVWMRQKRVQGSHFAHLKQASDANKFVIERRIDPCMSEVFPWAQIPKAHMKMWKNEHAPGNMAVLVQSPATGLRSFEDVLEASAG
ncbi:crotonyl-CoA carboxylase/reductase [Microbaculum sp. FT89]|uniref:crotonyl-CoA carboxylase/reductase n=1 Tax=Microbaculum sp. FT89 TaxID=3447298 RepID=UPI003F52F0A7